MLLLSNALAAELPEVPAGAASVGVLVCPLRDACDDDARWVAETAGPNRVDFVRLDLLLALDEEGWSGGRDARARIGGARDRALAEGAKGRWRAALAAADDGLLALRDFDGTVSNQVLFELWFLRGAAQLARGEDRGHEYSFRQAAAVGWGQAVELPPHDERTLRAYTDESRKLVVGGVGRLSLGEPALGSRYFLDGVDVGVGRTTIEVLPGTHRVTAVAGGRIRTWRAEVPVLASRTSEVTASFSPEDSPAWVQARIEEAFDTLEAPPSVTSRLSAWALRHGLSQVELLEVDVRDVAAGGAEIALSGADPRRAAASEGERVDHGDGIPATYEEEVAAAHEAALSARRASTERTLRLVYFDPYLRRFSTESGASLARPETAEPKFRLSGQVGYTRMLEHDHVALDAGGSYRFPVIAVEARLGLVRAQTPYNLYAEWVDLQLYHVALAARWAPEWDVRPFVAAGPEIYIPVAVGGRLAAGVEARIDTRWIAALEGHLSVLDAGVGGGVGIAIGRGY